MAELSPQARDLLLLCAASPHPIESLLLAVTGSRAGLDEALATGIVKRHEQRLRFAHPLLASFVYASVGPEVRRDAHRRLAAVNTDPDDRALHLARASEEPEAAIAAELEAAALRAYRRGAPAAAAELEQHAHRLTPAELVAERLARAARTADYHLAAGDTARGRELLERLLEERVSGAERARLALALGQVRYLSDDVAAAHALFAVALAQAGDDERLQADAEQSLAFTSRLGGDIPAALAHARASLGLAEQLDEPGILALARCRVALNEFLSGQGLDRAQFERAMELEHHLDQVPFEQLPSYTYASLAVMADDLETARVMYERVSHAVAEYGDERALPTVLFAVSELECRVGNWGRAAKLAADAVEHSLHKSLAQP